MINKNDYKYLKLPKIYIQANIIDTLCKIQEELGELTQYIGKFSGASGEKNVLIYRVKINCIASELCDVIQCCFTMLYILKEDFDINLEQANKIHICKLIKKGYYKEYKLFKGKI